MNPIFNNYSNNELAGEIENYAGKQEVKGRKNITMSIEFMRLVATRLRRATEEDLETAVSDKEEEICDLAKQKLDRISVKLSELADEVGERPNEEISRELGNLSSYLDSELESLSEPIEDDF
jgi:hypothetical protein